MSIKAQRIIQYIPFVNLIIVFFWIGKCFKNGIAWLNYAKAALTMCAFIVIVTLLRWLIETIVDNDVIKTIIFLIYAYLVFFIMARVSLKAQERMAGASKKA